MRRHNPRTASASVVPPRRAVTVLEMALVMPAVLALIFGSIEFGYVIYVKQTLQAASRDGARRAAIGTADNAGVRQAVTDAMEAGGLGTADYSIRIMNAATGSVADVNSIPAGTGVCVEVNAPWSQFSVFLSGFGDWTRAELRARTVMQREN